MFSPPAQSRPAVPTATVWLRLLAACAALGLAGAALAQGPLVATLERALIVTTDVDGEPREELVPAFELAPGETIHEAITVHNVSDEALRDVVVVLPVPEGARYLTESAAALDLAGRRVLPEFSHDAGTSFGVPPLMQEVTVIRDGKKIVVQVPVPPEAYTHVRWVLPRLESQTAITATLRAVIR